MAALNSKKGPDGLTPAMREHLLRADEGGMIKQVPASVARGLCQRGLGEVAAKDTTGLTRRFPRVAFQLSDSGRTEVARLRMVSALENGGNPTVLEMVRRDPLAVLAQTNGWRVHAGEVGTVVLMTCTRINPRDRRKIEHVRVRFDTVGRPIGASWTASAGGQGGRRAPGDYRQWVTDRLTALTPVSS